MDFGPSSMTSNDRVLVLGGNLKFFLFHSMKPCYLSPLNFPTILGCGFIGRHIVKYLVDNNLASVVRVVDKVPPQIAWLNNDHKAVFESSTVEFHSANLIHQSKHHWPCHLHVTK